jgi:hypothetical protein
LSKSGRRRVLWKSQSAAQIEEIRRSSERAADAIAGFEEVVARIPELGMAVAGRKGFYSRPFHTDKGSYLVVYTFNAREVDCIAIRPVPSTAY